MKLPKVWGWKNITHRKPDRKHDRCEYNFYSLPGDDKHYECSLLIKLDSAVVSKLMAVHMATLHASGRSLDGDLLDKVGTQWVDIPDHLLKYFDKATATLWADVVRQVAKDGVKLASSTVVAAYLCKTIGDKYLVRIVRGGAFG